MMQAALVLPETTVGMIEASATRKPERPWTRSSGSSLSAQARYAAGTREILECWFEDRPIREEYLIVDGGKLAGAGAHSYSVGKRA